MAEGRQGVMVLDFKKGLSLGPELLTQFQTRVKDLESGFKSWLSKQPLPVEAAVVTAASSVQGAAIGALMSTLTPPELTQSVAPPPGPGASPDAMASLKTAQVLSGGPLIQARNFAIITGVNAGISCVMKRLRGKEDIESNMVAAFGSGAMFALISGMGNPNQVSNMITSGLGFALVSGGLYKAGAMFNRPKTEDVLYSKTSTMLSNLGLQKYERNFKRGLLTDDVLPLLNDSALQDVRIPPGPRLLILDHIQRDPALKREVKRAK